MNKRAGLLNKVISAPNLIQVVPKAQVTAFALRDSAWPRLLGLPSVSFKLPVAAS